MKIILDTNILFSLMKQDSAASQLFSLLNAEFFAPDFILEELKEHEEECRTKFRISKEDFAFRLASTQQKVKLLPVNNYLKNLNEALRLVDDSDDAPYLALALALNAPIWSNDAHLQKQLRIKVYTTEELIDLLLEE